MPTRRGRALKEAAELAGGDRQLECGDIEENFGRTRAILGLIAPHLAALTEADIQLVIAAMKLSRNASRYKRDHILDLINYFDFYVAFKEGEANDSSPAHSTPQHTEHSAEPTARTGEGDAEQLAAAPKSWFIQSTKRVGRYGLRLVIGIDPGYGDGFTSDGKASAKEAFEPILTAWEKAAQAARPISDFTDAIAAVERLTDSGYRASDVETLSRAVEMLRPLATINIVDVDIIQGKVIEIVKRLKECRA